MINLHPRISPLLQPRATALYALIASLLSLCTPALAAEPAATPSSKAATRWAVIVLYPGVYNTEFMAPYDIFDHAGIHMDRSLRVVTVARDRKPLRTAEGLIVSPDRTFGEAPPAEILVVPSGERYRKDIEDAGLVGFIRTAAAKARLTMSHCDGAFLLAKAGLLDGLKATTFPADVAEMRGLFPKVHLLEGVKFVEEPGVITSAGGVASYDASLYAVRRLYGDEVAKKVAKGLVIDDWSQERFPWVSFERRAGAEAPGSPRPDRR